MEAAADPSWTRPLHGQQGQQQQFYKHSYGSVNHYQEVAEVMKQVDTLVNTRRQEWERQRDTLATQLQQCDEARVQLQLAYSRKHAEASESDKHHQHLQQTSNAIAAR